MPIYDSEGNLKVASTTKLEIQASGSVVTTSASILNFSGSGGIGVAITNQGLNGVFINISGSAAEPAADPYVLAIASGSTGEIVTSSANFINFTGPGITSVVISGSGVTVTTTTGSGGGSSGGAGTITVLSGAGTVITTTASFVNFAGNAIWNVVTSGSGVTVTAERVHTADFLQDFATGATAADRNVWQLATDPLDGETNWAVALIAIKQDADVLDNDQRLWATGDQFLNAGCTMRAGDTTFGAYFYDSALAFQTATAESELRQRADPQFFIIRFVNGTVSCFRNGYYTNGIAVGAAGAYEATTYPFTVGGDGEAAGSNPAAGYGIHAIGYITRSISENEISHWWRHVYVSGTLVDIPYAPGNGLNGAWRVVGGVNPSGTTWSPFIGASNLTKTGTSPHSTGSYALSW